MSENSQEEKKEETQEQAPLPKGFGYWDHFRTQEEAERYCDDRNKEVPYKEYTWRKKSEHRFEVYIRDRE